MNKKDEIEKEMKLIIQIVLYLFLAFAFILDYNIAYFEYTNNPPQIGYSLIILFMVGIWILIFAFMTLKFDNTLSYIFTYLGIFVFLVFIFYMFFGYLNQALGAGDILQGILNNFPILIESDTFWVCFGFVFAIFLIGIILLLLKHKKH